MQRDFFYLSWADFDATVARLAHDLRQFDCTGVYGVPRGGLVLAVAISHHLGLPLLDREQNGMIWVDDIVDTGKTFSEINGQPVAKACIVNLNPKISIFSAFQLHHKPWVVFPWEDKERAEQDMKQFLCSR